MGTKPLESAVCPSGVRLESPPKQWCHPKRAQSLDLRERAKPREESFCCFLLGGYLGTACVDSVISFFWPFGWFYRFCFLIFFSFSLCLLFWGGTGLESFSQSNFHLYTHDIAMDLCLLGAQRCSEGNANKALPILLVEVVTSQLWHIFPWSLKYVKRRKATRNKQSSQCHPRQNDSYRSSSSLGSKVTNALLIKYHPCPKCQLCHMSGLYRKGRKEDWDGSNLVKGEMSSQGHATGADCIVLSKAGCSVESSYGNPAIPAWQLPSQWASWLQPRAS